MITSDYHETLDKSEFNDEIQAHGVDVLLRRGIQCPCFDAATGQPDPGCSACDGFGYVWDAGSTVRAFGPNRRINRNYETPGLIDLGDAYFTFAADSFVGYMDRMKVPSEIIVVSELFTKGQVNALTGATKEKSRFQKIITPVERAVWSKRNPPSGTPYTYDLTELAEGVDFTIVNGNQINWLAGSPPAEGARYSLRFRTEAEYLVWAPRGRAEGAQQMPAQYLCKRLDFIRVPQ